MIDDTITTVQDGDGNGDDNDDKKEGEGEGEEKPAAGSMGSAE